MVPIVQMGRLTLNVAANTRFCDARYARGYAPGGHSWAGPEGVRSVRHRNRPNQSTRVAATPPPLCLHSPQRAGPLETSSTPSKSRPMLRSAGGSRLSACKAGIRRQPETLTASRVAGWDLNPRLRDDPML